MNERVKAGDRRKYNNSDPSGRRIVTRIQGRRAGSGLCYFGSKALLRGYGARRSVCIPAIACYILSLRVKPVPGFDSFYWFLDDQGSSCLRIIFLEALCTYKTGLLFFIIACGK